MNNHFDKLYFLDCNLEKPLITDSKIIVPVTKLGLMPNHPSNKYQELVFLNKAYLVFNEVTKSIQETIPYKQASSNPDHFEPIETNKKINIHKNTLSTNNSLFVFKFEGTFDNPLEWVEWEIESSSFQLLEYLPEDLAFTEQSKNETS